MEELLKTFLEEYLGAIEQLEKERYKNATILLSKALFALCDFLIQQKLQKLPKNHSERFRILEKYYPNVYLTVDMIFTHYTDAYSQPILQETCILIKNGIKTIAGTENLPEEVKKIIR
ncbi:TPA: hypothetical protein HA242_07125 [Candidatus Woesearchaeota archaeon]|nr:hypothetical protein [Candidatus Woesearchaeota archaeon]HIH13467.1 hypothetical protein [Candidatus Woesearchaeota archaeon]